jgi:hypothetical protein
MRASHCFRGLGDLLGGGGGGERRYLSESGGSGTDQQGGNEGFHFHIDLLQGLGDNRTRQQTQCLCRISKYPNVSKTHKSCLWGHDEVLQFRHHYAPTCKYREDIFMTKGIRLGGDGLARSCLDRRFLSGGYARGMAAFLLQPASSIVCFWRRNVWRSAISPSLPSGVRRIRMNSSSFCWRRCNRCLRRNAATRQC